MKNLFSGFAQFRRRLSIGPRSKPESEIPPHIELTPDEYLRLAKLASYFCKSAARSNPPAAHIFLGVPGSGKTTIRRQKCGAGFVNLDLSDILALVRRAVGRGHPRGETYLRVVTNMAVEEALVSRRDLAIEVIGDDKAILLPLFQGLKAAGYKIELDFIECEPVEANKRLKAIDPDADYFSALYGESVTLAALYTHLGLDPAPLQERERKRESG